MWCSAAFAVLLAFATMAAILIPLHYLQQPVAIGGWQAIEVVEGISKLVASASLLRLSLRLPGWLGVGANPASATTSHGELAFQVAWNVWRQTCEVGVYLVPIFLRYPFTDHILTIPLSSLAGVGIGVGIGLVVHALLRFLARRELPRAQAALACVLSGWLSCGLFSRAMHDFERAVAVSYPTHLPTATLFRLPGCNGAATPGCAYPHGYRGMLWSETAFPMCLIVPIGYAHGPTIVQLASFWACFLVHALLHLARCAKAKPGRAASVRLGMPSRAKTNARAAKGRKAADRNTSPDHSVSDAGAPAPASAITGLEAA